MRWYDFVVVACAILALPLIACDSPGGDSTETHCCDGIDNDGDFAVDCDDADCCGDTDRFCNPTPPHTSCPTCATETICDDDVDNDGDGDEDCADEDCRGVGTCPAVAGSAAGKRVTVVCVNRSGCVATFSPRGLPRAAEKQFTQVVQPGGRSDCVRESRQGRKSLTIEVEAMCPVTQPADPNGKKAKRGAAGTKVRLTTTLDFTSGSRFTVTFSDTPDPKLVSKVGIDQPCP